MLDIAHLRKVYRDYEGMIGLTKDEGSLLDHYYPDFHKLVDCIANDHDWIAEVCMQIGIPKTDWSYDAMETAIQWGLTWATYALGPALVREHLQDETRKPWLAALAIAGADPQMFMSGRKRAPVNQWLGELIAVYALNRRAHMEEQLDEPLNEEFVDIVIEGFIIQNIHDQQMGERVHKHAVAFTGALFSLPEALEAHAALETMH